MITKRTFERRRKQLKKFGINIDMSPVTIEQTNIVPFIRVLEAKPADVPHWAFDKNIVH